MMKARRDSAGCARGTLPCDARHIPRSVRRRAFPPSSASRRILRISAIGFVLLLFPALLTAQQQDWRQFSDEAFIAYLRSVREGRVVQGVQGIAVHAPCRFDLTLETARRLSLISPALKQDLESLLRPLRTQTDIVSASGKFIVHFDTTGSNTPALLDAGGNRIPGTAHAYATALAVALDSAYEMEVVRAGYLPPPFETGRNTYAVYIREMVSDYGWTVPVVQIPSTTVQPLYTTYMEIDNDFAGKYYTKGLDGARATVAHEFHHMIQLGRYGAWYSDRWVHEMSSTYYEDYVFDRINDYYQYLPDFFAHTERPLYAWGEWGYPLIVLPKMLEKRFPSGVLRGMWEGMQRYEPVTALDNALRNASPPSDLTAEMCIFARWNYATGFRFADAAPEDRYDEGAVYPLVSFASTIELAGDTAAFGMYVPPLGTVFVRAFTGADTVAFSVTNIDVEAAKQRSASPAEFQLTVRKGPGGDEFTPIGNEWFYRFKTFSPGNLYLTVFAKGRVPDIMALVYPNPYDPQRDGLIRFSIPSDIAAVTGELAVYSVSMDLVDRTTVNVRSDALFGRYMPWDGTVSGGRPLGSGVYIYFIRIAGRTLSGKFAVVRR
ncbi:MAG: hypothetical protein QHI48_04895 [Bacteroidota bacterium]|nr:hypothetical protein [Bacteroidota bacterium]